MSAQPASTAAPSSPGRTRVLWSLLTLALALATIAVSASGAVFTASDAAGNNTFATGTVDLSRSHAGEAVVAASDMAPGDAVQKAVTLLNSGSLELRYAMTSTTSEDQLAAQLDMWVWSAADEADATTNATCDATPGNGIGSYLYAQGPLGSTGGTNVIGNPAQGTHTGDRVLAAGAEDVLCFHVALPLETDSTYENMTSTATFDLQAEQTANNA